MKKYGLLNLAAIVIAAILFFSPAVILYTDYLWFSSLGFTEIFRTVLYAKLGLFAAAGVVSFLFLYLNYIWIKKVTDSSSSKLVYLAIAILSIFLGLQVWNSWELVLRFINQVPFDISEPLTGLGVSFFVYNIPFINFLLSFATSLIFFSAVFCLVMYAISFGTSEKTKTSQTLKDILLSNQRRGGSFATDNFFEKLKTKAYRHLSFLGSLFLFTIAGKIFLSRYDLFLNQGGAVFGVGFADANILLPILSALAVVAGLAGVAALVMSFGYDKKYLVWSGSVFAGVAVIGLLVNSVVQSYVVSPDEFNKEKSYLEHQIEMTRKGFALERINEEQFEVANNLSKQEVDNNKETIDNLRLWDYRPLKRTYSQLQNFRTYYQFNDVDTDRYKLNGKTEQVMLSARELDPDALPEKSQTWVNRHLVYTHGFGLAMSPVSKVTEEGFPEFYVKNVPPTTTKQGIDISQPRIYYGEETDDYVIVNTKTSELDYPSGNKNVYNNYQADGGVEINSLLDRVLFAYRFASPQILFSGSIDSNSRIQFTRSIQERVRKITPFFKFDDDPYLVAGADSFYWIYDGYTTSSRFPYSEHVYYRGEKVNYMRNSVKVAINAYTGDMKFYVADQDDPLVQTYSNMFPSLFQPMNEMPNNLEQHIRYPEDYFTIQTRSYFDYHMTDPKVFYNREDQWEAPEEKLRGRTAEVEPYYVMMKLPGEDKAEFMLVQPFKPRGRENMIGWVGARSDQPNYGEMRAYLFSKQKLIYGPSQIESRIDQDTEISQKMTLWSQRGSSVFRGNLLAIPINNSMMYFEPIFLESSGKGSLPQLKRVIIAQGDRLVMEQTVDQALDSLFGARSVEDKPAESPKIEPEQDQQKPSPQLQQKLDQIRSTYQEARDALNQGNLQGYAEQMQQFEQELEQL